MKCANSTVLIKRALRKNNLFTEKFMVKKLLKIQSDKVKREKKIDEMINSQEILKKAFLKAHSGPAE